LNKEKRRRPENCSPKKKALPSFSWEGLMKKGVFSRKDLLEEGLMESLRLGRAGWR